MADCPKKEVDKMVELMYTVFEDLPGNFKHVFGKEFNLPLRCETSVGPNWGEMVEVPQQEIQCRL